MENYQPPFTLTPTILSLVASICEQVGQLNSIQGLASQPHLRRNNKIRSIHASLKIEANSLSLEQVRDVLNGKPVLGPAAEIREVKNAYAAYENLTELNPYDLQELKKRHGLMTNQLLDQSGCFRSNEEGVFNGQQCIFMAPPARFVPSLMEELFTWMNRAKASLHPLILSSIFHYEFVFIHPFADGNGRMARLWHTALLAHWQPLFEYLPLESQIEQFQEAYYDAIAQCHREGESTSFITFMLQQTEAILRQLSQQSTLPPPQLQLSSYVQRLLAVMQPHTNYTALQLMELLQLKSRESLRRHYLHPALEAGVLHMTLPDKPRSRNQCYYKE